MYSHIKSKTQRVLASLCLLLFGLTTFASSHREAPLIANDPLADNTDLYVFRSPDDTNSVTIIANYVPLQLPHGGPNYYQFGENIRYEIHIDNDVSTSGDDIIYRFTFQITDQDPTTFFNVRLGLENRKTSYTMERSMDGGASFQTLISNGIVPPYNIGTRSVQSLVGLGASDYASLMTAAIATTNQGESVFCGPVDDPFFVDLAGIFDLGDAPRQSGIARDGVACKNVSTIAIKVPISILQKDGKAVSMANNILDGDFVIGVWASASRQMVRTLNAGSLSYSGNWVQVSRLGMPLTNEAVIPIGAKDAWNARSPYNEDPAHFEYFYNPELGLYMDDAQFGAAVLAFAPLRIQRNSLGAFDFGNGQDGLYGLKGNPALAGTALDDAIFGTLLLPAAGKPRSVDLWPAFHTGVPNLEPYQLATGKGGNPLATGKPFVNNFLPNGGDMLRLNMAVPVTPRTDPAFSSLGLIQAAVLGLTDPTYAGNSNLQFIPNMDGFPNGRRLEDDVTRIELQAVSGVVLAAIGLWYDDFDPNDPNASPLTQDLLDVLTYTTQVENNDTTFRTSFPYVQQAWDGTGKCGGEPVNYIQPTVLPPTQSAGAFTLINAVSNQDIGPLMDGDTIDLATLSTAKLNIRVETFPSMVGSVVFGWNGNASFQNQNNPPYALFGSTKGTQPISYFQNVFVPGTYTVSATPYSSASGLGTAGVPSTITFTVVDNAPVLSVSAFTLYNAQTDQLIGPLLDGSVVDLAAIGTNKLAILTDVEPDSLGSVGFTLNGNVNFRKDNLMPYVFPGDNGNGNFYPMVYSPGSYTLTATPYSSRSLGGDPGNPLTVNFTVVNGGGPSMRQANPALQPQPQSVLYPNPSKGWFNLNMKEGKMGEARVSVLNQVGQVVFDERFFVASPNWQTEVNLSQLPSGLYYLRLWNGTYTTSHRIVKE